MIKPFRYIYYTIYSRYLIKKYAAYERPKFEDRDILERIIFPYILIEFDPKKILDIGREDYQFFYNRYFSGRELWTIDIDPERKQFGSKNHIIDSAANLKRHFGQATFDFILMNGVFGWGLNKPAEIESAFDGISAVLKPGGIFIFGYNNVPDLVPVPLENIRALKKFTPYYFKPLGGAVFKSKNGEHTYNFYNKPRK